MDSRRLTKFSVDDPRSSIWNLSLDRNCERAPLPKSILRNPSFHSSPKKNVQFRDRDCHPFVDRSLGLSDSVDTGHPGSAYLSRQGKLDDPFPSSRHVVPGRLVRFSCLVSGDSRSVRTNTRRELDSIWHPETSSPRQKSPPPESFHLLFHRSITRKELRWDLVNPLPMSRINSWLSCASLLDGPALGSTVFSARIHFRESRLWRLEQSWGPVVVRAKGCDQPITLRNILDEIFNYFQHPIEDANNTMAAAAIRREDIVDTWRQRNYNTYQPGYRRSPYMHDPFVRRVDFLLGFSLFRKLRLVSISGQCGDLVLSIR